MPSMHYQVVHRLLNRVSYAAIREALLLSISLDHHHISEDIIRHPRYKPTVSDDAAQTTVTASDISLEAASDDDTLFAADVTPLVLASQRNQFEIVKLLLSMGERIREPHDYHCACSDCRGAESFDELRFAKTRLNLYKGLASEAYSSLSNEDPLLAAFQLGHRLKYNAEVEKHFKVRGVGAVTEVRWRTKKTNGWNPSGKIIEVAYEFLKWSSDVLRRSLALC